MMGVLYAPPEFQNVIDLKYLPYGVYGQIEYSIPVQFILYIMDSVSERFMECGCVPAAQETARRHRTTSDTFSILI
jgi:hypothetical protein